MPSMTNITVRNAVVPEDRYLTARCLSELCKQRRQKQNFILSKGKYNRKEKYLFFKDITQKYFTVPPVLCKWRQVYFIFCYWIRGYLIDPCPDLTHLCLALYFYQIVFMSSFAPSIDLFFLYAICFAATSATSFSKNKSFFT